MKTNSLKELMEEGFLGIACGNGMSNTGLIGGRNPIQLKEEAPVILSDEQPVLAEEKEQLLNTVKEYNMFAESIYRKHSLKEIVDKIKTVGRLTERVIYDTIDDWYDKNTFKKDMKVLSEDVKLFEKTAMEVSQLQHRLESVYESIGNKLDKYFELQPDQQKTLEEEPMTQANVLGLPKVPDTTNPFIEVDMEKLKKSIPKLTDTATKKRLVDAIKDVYSMFKVEKRINITPTKVFYYNDDKLAKQDIEKLKQIADDISFE